jgi:hypothetical protein
MGLEIPNGSSEAALEDTKVTVTLLACERVIAPSAFATDGIPATEQIAKIMKNPRNILFTFILLIIYYLMF